MDGCDIVYHLAGMFDPSRWCSSYDQTCMSLVRALLKAAEKVQVRRFVPARVL